MAINDMKGTVSTTGMVNNPPPKIQAPDMSKIKMPTAKKQAEPKQVVQKPVQQPQEEALLSKGENLTNEVVEIVPGYDNFGRQYHLTLDYKW